MVKLMQKLQPSKSKFQWLCTFQVKCNFLVSGKEWSLKIEIAFALKLISANLWIDNVTILRFCSNFNSNFILN